MRHYKEQGDPLFVIAEFILSRLRRLLRPAGACLLQAGSQ